MSCITLVINYMIKINEYGVCITSIIVRKCVKINFINFLDYSVYVIGMIQSLCLIFYYDT